MGIQFRVYGRMDLDGTHSATIEYDRVIPLFSENQTLDSIPCYIKLSRSGIICGCMIKEMRCGTTNRIYIDRFKQRYLNIKDGDFVFVEEFQPPIAQTVEMRVPNDFSQKDFMRFIGKPVTNGEKTALFTFSGDTRLVAIGKTNPDGIVIIEPKTDIAVSSIGKEEIPITYKDIGGLHREIKLIREIIEYPLRFPEVFEYVGIPQSKGIILHGPPGTGKTLIAKTLADEVGANFYFISGPEIVSMWYGESERKLRELFAEASENVPSVILIDELDSLTPKREKTFGQVEQRIVATMLTLMDGLRQLNGVVVLATTNRINTIDTALRREGRFGCEIHIGVPDVDGRKEILEIHTRRMPLDVDVNLEQIAERTVGFVGADIASLCHEAAYNTIRRSFSSEAFEKGQITPYEGLNVNQSDFENALRNITPSAMKEFLVEIPKVSWEDIGGLEEIKRILIENIAYAITKRDVFKKFELKLAKGILLYGPSGTGKTLLAKAVANQCGANFINVKGSEIRSKWFGESEQKISFLFTKAREVAPCVLFFDEVDAIVPNRGRDISGVSDSIVNQILSEIDGIEGAENVFVVGATNRIELLDPAILRPGRFDYLIEIPLPDPITRKAIFNIHTKNKPLAEDVNFDELVELSNGFSGAEIAEVCRESAFNAIRDAEFDAEKAVMTMEHIKNALNKAQLTKNKLNKI